MAREMSYAFTLGATLASSFKGAMTSSRKQIVGLARDVKAMEKSSTGRLGAAFVNSKNKIRLLGGELKSAKAQMAAFKAQVAAAGGASGILVRQIHQTENKIKTLSSSLGKAITTHQEHIATIKTEAGSLGNLTRQYRDLTAQMERARAKQKAFSANLAARDSNKNFRSNMRGGIMDAAVMGASLAIPAKFSIDFEDGIARAGALARASTEELELLSEAARKHGRDTVFTALQVTEAEQYLAMAGLNVKQTIAALPGSLELAAAGAVDLGMAADISTNIMTGFNIKAEEMGRVSDALTYTFTSSNSTLETLGETMKYVAPVASAVGMSMEEASAAAGLLAKSGIRGSQAGTTLRSALLRLTAPPKQAAEALMALEGEVENIDDLLDEVGNAQQALKELGVETKDSAGNMRPFVDILEELYRKTSHMGNAQQMECYKKIFGTTAVTGMVSLMNQTGQTVDENGRKIVDSYGNQTNAFRKYIEEIENSAGTGARVAEQMNNTTGGSLRVMRSALEDTAISIGNVLTPAIRTLAGGVTVAANKVSAFIQRFPTLSKVIGLAVGGTIMLVGGVMVLGYSYSFLRGGILLAQAAMLKMTGVQAGAAASAKGLTLAQRALAAATALAGMATKGVALAFRVLKFAMIGSGIGAILVGIGLAAGYIIENWDTVGPFFVNLWNKIVETAKTVWQYMKIYLWDKNPMMLAPRMIVENWDTIKGALMPVFEWLKEQFSWVSDSFKGLQKAWNYFFGDDNKAGTVSDASTEALARMEDEPAPLAAQPPVAVAAMRDPTDDAFGNMPDDAVFHYQSPGKPDQIPFPGGDPETADFFSRQPVNSDFTGLPGAGPAAVTAEITNETNITMDMKFDVQGLDETEFRKKINSCRDDFEKIVRRVIGQMERTQARTRFAQ